MVSKTFINSFISNTLFVVGYLLNFWRGVCIKLCRDENLLSKHGRESF